MASSQETRILIVGGGFAGVTCALRLSRELPHTTIELLSDRPHFEYTPALPRIVTGRSPLEVCLPLDQIFEQTGVRVVEDTVTSVDTTLREVVGASGSRYHYTYLVLALGSVTNYFGIPGLSEASMSIKSIADALRLKEHLHTLMTERVRAPREDQMTAGHVVVVGGGPSGVELAGELAHYAEQLAGRHGLDESIVTVDLIEAGPRILSRLPEKMGQVVEERLRALGVNIFCNRAVKRAGGGKVYLDDMTIEADTVVWTAGVEPNRLYRSFKSLTLDERGRVKVDPFLRASGHENVFVAGDAAATPFTGMAQTAIVDGRSVADSIARMVRGDSPRAYRPRKPSYALPLGDGWAAVLYHGVRLYGLPGWFLRRAADLRFFLQILPIRKAFVAFVAGWRSTESCPICSDNDYYVGELDDRPLPGDAPVLDEA